MDKETHTLLQPKFRPLAPPRQLSFPPPYAPNRVGADSYVYDANGNVLTGGGRSYNWNIDNKPSGIVGPGSMATAESYTYDPDGERVTRTRGATTTVFLAGGMWEEIVGTGAERRVLHSFGGQMVAQRSSTGSLIYLNSDHLGSASVTTDASGNNAQHQEFDPWGKVRSGSLNTQTTINYTGQRLDDGTGLLYYHARYYDSGLGRFLSADTKVPDTDKISVVPLTTGFYDVHSLKKVSDENSFIQEKGFWYELSSEDKRQAEISSGPSNVQELNRYSYVQNNPLKRIDPNGHDDYWRATCPDVAVWCFWTSDRQYFMRPVENHNDGYGWHFNLQIQPLGGGSDNHNYHIRYNGISIGPDGKSYHIFSYYDSVTGESGVFAPIRVGGGIDPALLAAVEVSSKLVLDVPSKDLAAVESALWNPNYGKTLYEQMEELMQHPEPLDPNMVIPWPIQT